MCIYLPTSMNFEMSITSSSSSVINYIRKEGGLAGGRMWTWYIPCITGSVYTYHSPLQLHAALHYKKKSSLMFKMHLGAVKVTIEV